MPARFAAKIAIVTGATSGIGREVALQLAAEGARVAVAGRSREHGEDVARDIRHSGGEALYINTDVSRAESVRCLVARVVEHYGGLDLAFNNAGISGEAGKPSAEQSERSWDEVIATNLTGTWLSMKHEIPAMLTRGSGAIVNNASYLGLSGADFGVAPYVASKHGVVGLTRSAALEYAGQGLRVNAICPGMTRTRMMDPALALPDDAFHARATVPLGRVAGTAEIARAVLWLLSGEASYVTGQTFTVDGGILAR